jgi:hypothetical protein
MTNRIEVYSTGQLHHLGSQLVGGLPVIGFLSISSKEYMHTFMLDVVSTRQGSVLGICAVFLRLCTVVQ